MSGRNKGIGQEIKRWRESAGITQAQFAEAMHVTQQTVSLWETVGMVFDARKLADIDRVLGQPAGTAVGTFARLATPEEEVDVDGVLAEMRAQIAELQAQVARLAAETKGRSTTRSRGRSS